MSLGKRRKAMKRQAYMVHGKKKEICMLGIEADTQNETQAGKP
jgi:hypothetical protein